MDFRKICESVGRLYLQTTMENDSLREKIVLLEKDKEDLIKLINGLSEKRTLPIQDNVGNSKNSGHG